MTPLPDLGAIMQYGSASTDESQPGDRALWLTSRPIPAGETARLCSVDVSSSNLIHSSESGVSVEIIGMTAADSGH